jgi:ABC-type nitrate/sulfonate/bicarbonate transport system substrate-binding protein
MKSTKYPIVCAFLLLFFASAQSQESKSAQEKQVAQILKNAATVDILIDKIVADDKLRAKALAKLAAFGKANPAKLAEMQKALSGASAAVVEKAGAEILIKFKPGAKDDEITAMASEVGLQYLKSIPQLRVKVYRITSGKSAKEVIEHCEKHEFVEYAEQNQKYKIQK